MDRLTANTVAELGEGSFFLLSAKFIPMELRPSIWNKRFAESVAVFQTMPRGYCFILTTTDQVQISSEVAKRELRAYVTALSANIEIRKADNFTNMVLKFTVSNSEKTTANINLEKIKI